MERNGEIHFFIAPSVAPELRRAARRIQHHLQEEGVQIPIGTICHQLSVLTESDPLESSSHALLDHIHRIYAESVFPDHDSTVPPPQLPKTTSTSPDQT